MEAVKMENLDLKADSKFDADGSGIELDEVPVAASGDVDQMTAQVMYSANHRNLNARQIRFTSFAGAIGAVLFVAIGSGVPNGPLPMLLAFIFWATVIYCIAQCQMEIVTLFPLDGSFIRLAGRMVDPALGVAVGYNHFFAQASYVIFEATIINTVVAYWGYDQSPAILITVTLIIFLALNVYRADVFGEAEFWLALFKFLLAAGMIFYTIIVMCGGNPIHDRFGFRYWKDPGPWTGNDASTQLQSFINAVIVAGFCQGGPEYISMIAGEAKDPRKTIPAAFKTIMFRMVIFFIGGALCVGILVPANDKTIVNGSGTYAGNSPYVISMERLQIPVLPSIINAILVTVILSGGNAYTFNASRSLHALALDHKAPGFLRKTNKHGVPYLAVLVVMGIGCLAYLALNTGSAKFLSWLLNFCTAATMLNWCVMSFTYIRFNSALKAQGIDKKEYLPVTSKILPYGAYWALFWSLVFILVQGYSVFLDGNWGAATFVFNYGIIAFAAVIGLGFKIFDKTRFYRSKEVDLHTDLDFFDALDDYYQRVKDEKPPATLKDKIIAKMF